MFKAREQKAAENSLISFEIVLKRNCPDGQHARNTKNANEQTARSMWSRERQFDFGAEFMARTADNCYIMLVSHILISN